jgi:HAMP domain-containing protein
MTGHETAGWMISARDAWWFLGAWLVVALGHALWRSWGRGEARQDPLRPSGPTE